MLVDRAWIGGNNIAFSDATNNSSLTIFIWLFLYWDLTKLVPYNNSLILDYYYFFLLNLPTDYFVIWSYNSRTIRHVIKLICFCIIEVTEVPSTLKNRIVSKSAIASNIRSDFELFWETETLDICRYLLAIFTLAQRLASYGQITLSANLDSCF